MLTKAFDLKGPWSYGACDPSSLGLYIYPQCNATFWFAISVAMLFWVIVIPTKKG